MARLSITEVQVSSIDGRPCVALGEECLVIYGEWSQNAGRWRFRLNDLRTPILRSSSWVTLASPDNLVLGPRSAAIRGQVRAEWENWREIIDWTIREIQDNSQAFIVEEITTEETEAAPEEDIDTIVLTEDEEAEILEILSSHGGIELLRLHLDNLVAGEEDNKLLTFVLLICGKTTDLTMKQMILFTGESGAGKSTLMSLADLFNTKDVGRFTKHALDWSNLAGFEILRLKEFGQMDSEDQGVSTLKFLSADDQGYIVENAGQG